MNPIIRSVSIGALMLILYFYEAQILHSADFADTIRREAQKMSEAMRKGDFNTLIDYALPKVVHMVGKDKALAQMRQMDAQMKKEGFFYDSATIGTPGQVSDINGKLYVLIPETVKIKAPGGMITKESHLMAISEDKGKRWYFVDTAGLVNEEVFKDTLPDVVGRIEIPTPKQTTFTPDPKK